MMHFNEILSFLTDLKLNNNREWFERSRTRFEKVKSDFSQLVETLIAGIGKVDPDIKPLLAKDCIFRQYRDVRFSNDKTPYKIHLGAYLNKGGKKINTAGYYIHIEPGKSMIAGGLYHPEPVHLRNVRQEIDYNLAEWENIIKKKEFKAAFPEGISREDSLKRPPRGYDADNPSLKYVMLKSFVFVKPLPDNVLTGLKNATPLVKNLAVLTPAVHFLNSAELS